MKKNIGTLDKGIRLAIALIIVILDINDVITGTLGDILLIVAILLVITTFVGTCPLYLPFGWNSNKRTEG
jgi:hypothetical protein